MKALRTTLIVLFCLAGLWCGLLSVRPAWLEPVPGVRLEQSRPILREADLKPDSAFALLRQACDAAPDSRATSDLLDLVVTNAWSPAIQSNVTAFLDEAQPCLELARRAGRAPDPQVTTVLSVGGTSRRPIGGMRDIARLFRISVAAKAGAGDLAGACRDIEDGIRSADILSRGGTLIDCLVDVACGNMMCAAACRLSMNHALPDDTARRLQAAVLDLDAHSEPWAECVRQERRFNLAALDEMYASRSACMDVFGSRAAGALILLGPLVGSTREISRANIDACFTHLVALAERPYDGPAYVRFSAQIGDGTSLWPVLSHKDPVGLLLARFLLPAFGSARTHYERKHIGLRAAALAMALNRYRAANGRWPADLNELVPAFIAAVPGDPFARGPLRYRADNAGGWVIYSVGPDGADDGGTREDDRDVVFPGGK